jgi:hypothetical protein
VSVSMHVSTQSSSLYYFILYFSSKAVFSIIFYYKFCLNLNRKWAGKIYFNEMKKEICLYQLFSKLRNYFSTKSPRTSIHFRQRCTSFWNPSQAFHFAFVTQIRLPLFSIFEPPYPASYCAHINTLITINGLHLSVNFNWRNFFRG